MSRTAVLGLPRVGPNRELKFALEAHWAGRSTASELLDVAADLRAAGWRRAVNAGIDVIPSGDFSLYDHVLDTAFALGAIPERFGDAAARDLGMYFAMARGSDVARPLEMTKWFDTNYHYLVPELRPAQAWNLRADHWLEQLAQARAVGIQTRPVVLGPLTFLLLAKGLDEPLRELPALAQVYAELIAELALAGAREIQIDEPCLALDVTPVALDAFAAAWSVLSGADERVRLTLSTYFAGLEPGGVLERVLDLDGLDELHLDLVRAPDQLADALTPAAAAGVRLSLGVVNGRNVWRTDLDRALEQIDAAVAALGTDRVTIAPSCSLLHLPHDASLETGVDAEVREWLAFAAQRLGELSLLRQAGETDAAQRDRLLAPARAATRARLRSPLTNNAVVRERAGKLDPGDYDRESPFPVRRTAQRARVALPHPADDDDRLLPADPGDPPGTPRRARRPPRAGGIRVVPGGQDRRRPWRCRRSSASTCSSTASPSATTWSSTSASSSPASRSRPTDGSSPTAAAASSRRFSTAMSPAPRR